MNSFLKFIHSFSIYTKLAILIFIIILIFSSSIIFLAINTLKDQTNEIITEMVDSDINSNKDFLTDAILARDSWALFKFVKSLSQNRIIKNAGVIDLNNVILAHTDTKNHKVGTILDDKSKYDRKDFSKDGVLLGYFVLNIEKESINNILNKNNSNNFLYMMLAALISFLIAIYFIKNLLDRLSILVDNAKAISLKRWDDIKEIQSVENDEITALVITITSLMKEMKNSIEQEKVTHSLETLGEISSLFAHQVKNLLLPLKLLLEDGDEINKEDIKIINTTLQRIDAQVIDFLALGKPLDKKEEHALYVKDIMKEIKEILKPIVNKEDIVIKYSIDPNIKVNLNKNSIEMILLNLVTNSIEALDANGLIEISWQEHINGMSLLSVSDNGKGIPHNIRSAIFKPFYTTKKKGSGLGLFTVYKIVYLSKGYMRLEDDEKTTFKIYLPSQKDDINENSHN